MEELANVFKALSDPLRLKILKLLPKMGEKEKEICVCELASKLGISQPNVSHHLGILKSAGLVRCEKSGGFSYYIVDLEKAQEALNRLRNWM
ncbi:MAG: ArsR/SmtB family transcription factor [bacterium]